MEKTDQENKYKAPSLGEGDAPWLVFTHGNSKKTRVQTFCTIPPNNNVYVKSIPELRGRKIQASFHGWLLLRDFDNHNMYSLWDPITSHLIILPPLPPRANDNDDDDEYVCETCALTSPPTCDTCVLFLFFDDQVFFCRPSTSTSTITWTSHRLELDGQKVLCIKAHVTLNGNIHSLTYVEHSEGGLDINLTTIEIVDNSLSLKSLEIVRPVCGYFCINCIYYLVESCGCIYCVIVDIQHAYDDKITILKVWELNLLERNWVEVHSLNGRAFFVGIDCCTWCWGSIGECEGEGIQGDCVYLVIDKHIIFCYSLCERSSTLLSPDQDLLIYPLNTGIWVNAVMPQHQRISIIKKGTQWSKENKNTVVKDDVSDHEMSSRNTISQIKQLPQDDEAHGEESPLINLPEDMMHLIAKYIHKFDYCNFRASCTRLRSALPPVQWRTKNSLPLLIFFKDDHGLCKVMDPSQDYSSYNILRFSLDLFTVHFSKDGWVIMETRCEGYSLKFFNPFTKEIVNFPSQSCFMDLRSIGFSTYPTSPDCVTVAFDYTEKDMEILYFQSGDETWRSCDFPVKFIPATSSPVYFEGSFYVLDESGKLGAFKLVDEEGKWRVYENQPSGNSLDDPYSYHLLECDGELVAVFIGYMGECVDVFKFNFCKEKWVKVKRLGNYSLFLGKSSFSVKITEVGMKNRIYISRIKGSSMIYYSLETGKFHASKSQDLIPDFRKTTWHMDSFWL